MNHAQRHLRRIFGLLVATSIAVAAAGCWRSQSITLESGNKTSSMKGFPSEAPAASNKLQFEDIAAASGVNWTGRNGEEAKKLALLEAIGTGCAVDDYDRDENPDLFFAGGGEFGVHNEILPLSIGLFRQVSAWKFVPVAIAAGMNVARNYNHGMWTADIDDDGFSELLVTGWGGLQLYHNRGDGTFSDVTGESGLDDSMWSTAAGWADLNKDHILDLYVGHYVNWSFENNPVCVNSKMKQQNVCAPTDFPGLPCTVYLGNGDGTFREGGQEMGIHEIGKVLGVVTADINGDRQPDLYVANDTLPNHLYVSQPSGKYKEVAIEFGVALGETGIADGSMGVDLGDLDGDGKIDIWVANYEEQSFAIYRNLGGELFTHASRPFGVTAVGTLAVGFGTVIFDADGDGFSDIFCANGHIWAPNLVVDRRQRPYLFWNDRGQKLLNIAPKTGKYMREKHLGRGAATGDLDSDGTPDLVVTHTNEPVAVLKNTASISNWLSIRLIGRTSPRSAIGAVATVTTGTHQQIGLVKGGGSYLSTSDRTLLFGLGSAVFADSVRVDWPSGRTTELKNIPGRQRMTLIEGTDTVFTEK